MISIPNKDVILYAAYTFTCLEDRAWSFFATIVFELLGGMYFVSIAQFSESFLQMMLGGFLGQFIDRISRKHAIILVVVLNNFSILFSVFTLTSEYRNPSSGPPILLYLSVVLCAINRLFLNAEKSIITRDWVVTLNHKNALARQNAMLTGFDQLLNILAPVIVGTMITSYGTFQNLVIFAIGSMISLALKSKFLFLLYTSHSSLQQRNSKNYKALDQFEEEEFLLITPSARKPSGVFSTYWKQSTFCAAFGMALFYKTVMGFDSLAVGYAKGASDFSIFTIGIVKSYGAIAGMGGVAFYALIEKRYGLVRAGYVGLVVQQVFALLAVSTIWMPGSPIWGLTSKGPSILIFLISIATSRFGLWCLDMAVTHAMQLHVPESERNTVFGFHMALCQTFSVPKEIVCYILTVLFNSMLIYLTINHTRQITGTYRNMIVVFASVGIVFSTADMLVRPDDENRLRWKNVPCVLILCTIMLFHYTIMIICGLYMYRKTSKYFKTSSTSMEKLQRQFFYALIYQTTAPTLLFHLPVSVAVLVPFFDFKFSYNSTIVLYELSAYPLTDTLILLKVVTEYKLAYGRFVSGLAKTFLVCLGEETPREDTKTSIRGINMPT
ncbi:unnamed protein product [Caenorhabditis nigoni]